MVKEMRERTDSFTWHSKQELYEYFHDMYKIRRSEVDQEIEESMKLFQLRKGRPINPQELWEKVGASLERRLVKQGIN